MPVATADFLSHFPFLFFPSGEVRLCGFCNRKKLFLFSQAGKGECFGGPSYYKTKSPFNAKAFQVQAVTLSGLYSHLFLHNPDTTRESADAGN